MSDEFKNEDFENENNETTLKKVKEWIQENLRVIVSVLIVALIASSIYSYSKRDKKIADNNKQANTEIEKILDNISSQDEKQKTENEKPANEAVSEEAATSENEEQTEVSQQTENNTSEQAKQENEVIKPEPENDNKEQAQPKEEVNTQQTNTAKETETSFIESAAPGDGLTNLARKALAHYLEKNPDSSLTPEHKIYIEDYLRKNVNYHGRIYTGTTVEFSKSLIKNAIDASKNLNDAQLKNLHKYAVNVRF